MRVRGLLVLLELLEVACNVDFFLGCSNILAKVVLDWTGRRCKCVLDEAEFVGGLSQVVNGLIAVLTERLEQLHGSHGVIKELRVAFTVSNRVQSQVLLTRFHVISGLVKHVGHCCDFSIVVVVDVLFVELLEIRNIVMIGGEVCLG